MPRAVVHGFFLGFESIPTLAKMSSAREDRQPRDLEFFHPNMLWREA
jgi:hypothetical protein